MKQCIWCKQTDKDKYFNTKAHSIPKSLGGKKISTNVCDDCNHYYGIHKKGLPSIELAIKEAFTISRVMFLQPKGEIGKNKILPKVTSYYFDINVNKWTIKPKMAYRLQSGFLQGVGRQLKRGVFKMFLEETDRVNKNGLDSKFDFIREFARYDLADYPVFYFHRAHAILMYDELLSDPQIHFEEGFPSKWIVNEIGFFEFELLGHVFGIPTSREYYLFLEQYIKNSLREKKELFKGMVEIKKFTDMDITLRFLKD